MLGQHLLTRRLLLKLTQKEVAARLNTLREHYGRWERDEIEPTSSFWPRLIGFIGYYPGPEIALAYWVLKARRMLGLSQYDFWEYPDFAQKMDVFCKLVDAVNHPNFGVNYDPSNTYLAGEDPIELLKRVSHRVVTMHASDRYLAEGTIEDLRKEEGGAKGYAKRLRHGEIGKGLNDYDAIFTELKSKGFNGWISIEDGVDGMEQLARSVEFLKRKIAQHWP